MSDFKLPDVGEGIAEGELLAWLVEVGDVVAESQVVAEVSTDKVTVELPSPRAGRVVELCWEVGDVVPVGQVLLRFEAAGSAPCSDDPATLPEKSAQPGNDPAAPGAAPGEGSEESARRPEGVVFAAPSVRRYATEVDVDLTAVSTPGRGRGGLIVRADVDAHRTQTPAVADSGDLDGGEAERLGGVRAAAAGNLMRSRSEQVLCTTTFQVEATGVQRLIEVLKPEGERQASSVGPLAVVAAACAAALRAHPRLNATVNAAGDGLLMSETVNLGIAVATDQGLIVPVVRGVENLRLFDLADRIRVMAGRARDRRVTVDDLSGGTFTISSTGGIERAHIISTTPVTVYPQVAILWVSRVTESVRVVDGGVQVVPILTASLTFDHRFVDGLEATEFVNDLAVYLRDPERAL